MTQVADIKSIRIADLFGKTPGARNIDEGTYSGEEFLQKILEPEFDRAVKEKYTLLIDLDDAEGYATSFLEEAFGGLARKFGAKKVLKVLDFKSDDEPLLIDEIRSYINEATS
jgi:hypothetical protein